MESPLFIRSEFGTLPKNVSKIGDFCINEFKKKGIGTIIKHIPGHGLAKVDGILVAEAEMLASVVNRSN